MTEIYLIRHGEAEGNLYRRIHGQFDSPLTPRGHRQVALLRERMKDIHIDAVYSSDLKRAMQTAAAVYEPRSLPLNTRKGLREFCFGVWENRPWGDMITDGAEAMRAFNSDPLHYSVEGGETFQQVTERITAAVTEIAEAHDGQTVAVFTHGSALRCLICRLSGLPISEISSIGHSDNTAVSLVRYDRGEWTVVYANDASHLGNESTLARQSWWKNENGFEDTNLSFRLENPDDFKESYLRLHRDAWLTVYGSLDGYDGEAFWLEAVELWLRYDGALCSAWLFGELAGMVQLDPLRYETENVLYIPFYCMERDMRDKGMGVQLLGYAVDLARRLRRTVIRLRVYRKNHVARRFYERCGFVKKGGEGKLIIMELQV